MRDIEHIIINRDYFAKTRHNGHSYKGYTNKRTTIFRSLRHPHLDERKRAKYDRRSMIKQ